MEVLEHGKVYERKNHVIRCDCGCKFKYEEKDTKWVARYFGEEYLYSGHYLCESVRCPECNELHLLDGMKPIVYHGLKERE
jgi:hypothetical protein